MQSELDFFSLILDATFLVQLVLLVLIIASIMSWTYIISRARDIKAALRQADEFDQRFWSDAELSQLYNELEPHTNNAGQAKIFVTGFREYIRLHKEGALSLDAIADTAHRSMKVSLAREVSGLGKHLNFLATVGSTTPYIGLFGTVWGIMHSFLALQGVQQATLSLVAPGIAEALVATAMGLFAAIPAVIAYNHFSEQVNQLVSRYDNFIEEFIAILHRQVHRGASKTESNG